MHESSIFQYASLEIHYESCVVFSLGRDRPQDSQVCYDAPHFFEKDSTRLSFGFRLRGGGGVQRGLEARDILRGLSDMNFPTSEDVCHASNVLSPTGGDQISEKTKLSVWIGLSLA